MRGCTWFIVTLFLNNINLKSKGDQLLDKIELLKEDENLKNTLNILNEETLKYIDKRKSISEYILDYRKKYIEEYRDDEDKLMEYFDHERYIKEESYKMIDKKLGEFVKLKESP